MATKIAPLAPLGEWGKAPHSHTNPRRVPAWVNCPAREFETRWLPKFEAGKLPACTDEEWERIRGLLHGEEI